MKEKIKALLGCNALNENDLHRCADSLVSKMPFPAGYFLEILAFFKRKYDPLGWMYVSRLSEAAEKFDYLCKQLLLIEKPDVKVKRFFYALCSCALIYPDISRCKIFGELLDKFPR